MNGEDDIMKRAARIIALLLTVLSLCLCPAWQTLAEAVDIYLLPGKDHFIQNVIRLVHDLGKKIRTPRPGLAAQGTRCGYHTGLLLSKPIPPESAIDFSVL